MNWILCFTLFFPLQDFHEREHKSEAAQSGEGFVHLRLQGEKIFANLHPLINFPTQVNPHTGDWSHWNSLMENYVPPDIRLEKRRLLSFILSSISPTNYGNILIPNVSSIRTDFLVDSCVR